MENQIKQAAMLFRASPMLGDDELFEMLVVRGIDRRLAAQLVEFLPMVYCRILFEGSGASFPESYYRTAPDGTQKQYTLSGDPVWNAVLKYARKEVVSRITDDEIRAIAQRGAEYRAAAQLIENGSALENIGFAPMVFGWPAEGPADVDVKGPSKPKWWPFGS